MQKTDNHFDFIIPMSGTLPTKLFTISATMKWTHVWFNYKKRAIQKVVNGVLPYRRVILLAFSS